MSEPINPPGDDPEGYVGMPADQAGELARERGWSSVRVVAPDALVTMEYRLGRINFAAERDVVVRCWIG